MLRLLIVIPVAFATALLALTACQSSSGSASGGAPTRTPAMTDLLGDWTLSNLEGQDVASMLPAGARKPDLSFTSDGKVGGYAGVNRLSSSLDLAALSKGQFKLGPMVTTRMAGPPEAMEVESKYTAALQRATGAKVGNNTLTLTDGAKELLTFARGK